jgi:DNA-binding NtrC family response regulator
VLTSVPKRLTPPMAKSPASRALRVLLVGLEPAAVHSIQRWLDGDAELATAADLSAALLRLRVQDWDVVVVMLGADPADDLGWWSKALGNRAVSTRLVALTRAPSIGLVVEATRLGVRDLLSVPLERDDFMRAIGDTHPQIDTLIPLTTLTDTSSGFTELVGRSAGMLQLYKLIAQLSDSAITVLLEGESGTGKELAARAIHAHGPRKRRPFSVVNCAAIPESLLESELFGHEKGAFTGAISKRVGRFEEAAGGTVFLDEIADMSLALQAKILRVIQEREIQRVGSNGSVPVDVRLIAATNRNLHQETQQGRFREDLYYRIAVVTVSLPPLRQRGDDIALLSAHFARHFGARCGKKVDAISDRALNQLRAHDWVGNVRELKNMIERAVLGATDGTLRVEQFPGLKSFSTLEPKRPDVFLTLSELEATHIERVLAHTGGQIGAAAEILGIHRNTLARKVREYGL